MIIRAAKDLKLASERLYGKREAIFGVPAVGGTGQPPDHSTLLKSKIIVLHPQKAHQTNDNYGLLAFFENLSLKTKGYFMNAWKITGGGGGARPGSEQLPPPRNTHDWKGPNGIFANY